MVVSFHRQQVVDTSTNSSTFVVEIPTDMSTLKPPIKNGGHFHQLYRGKLHQLILNVLHSAITFMETANPVKQPW